VAQGRTNKQPTKGNIMAHIKLTDEHLEDKDVLDLTAAELRQLDEKELKHFESILERWSINGKA
tara:strand:+ start:611 stop:802 length:192 start_codon:yes stop_codon:yes gene_type:complete